MKLILVVLITVAVMLAGAMASAPTLISYQGRLTDASGSPLTGTYTIQFAIYTSLGGGTYVWEETQSNVSVNDGLFSVLLGSITPISDTVFKDANRYLGVKVGASPELTPRTQLTSVPWSNRVASIDGASGGIITSKLTVGPNHTNTGEDAFIAGASNTVSGPRSNVGGGWLNNIEGGGSVIAGGERNYAPGSYTTISGGVGNQVDATSSTISGGDSNRVYFDGVDATISGGRQNSARDTCSAVGGGGYNQAAGIYSVVAGGGSSIPEYGNMALGDNSTISGGYGNIASGDCSTISGGARNNADSGWSTVGGGSFNHAYGELVTIAGGQINSAYGVCATVGGGNLNSAVGFMTTISGGQSNGAAGKWSTVPGGYANTASGDYSFAAGKGASALHKGCFMWHDATPNDGYQTVDSNQFMVYAAGGIYLSGSGIKSQFGAGPNLSITKGAYYMDNSIVAWGKVLGTGSISTNEFGVTSVVRNSAGNYTISLNITASAAANLIPIANAELDAAPNSAGTMRFVTINQVSANSFDVYITNGSFTPTDNDFVFIVTAR